MKMETQPIRAYGAPKSCSKREVHGSECLHRKTESSRINNLIVHLKTLESQEQTKPQISRWRQMRKIRAEKDKMKTKRTMQRINETKFFEKINKIDNPLFTLATRKSKDPDN